MKPSFNNPAMLLIDIMIANRLLDTQEQIDAYFNALFKLTTWKSTYLKTDYYHKLFYCFDDKGRIPAIHELIYYMERYDSEFRVKTLLDVTDLHIERASGYLAQFYLAVVAVDKEFEILVCLYPNLPETKKQIIEPVLLNMLSNFGKPDNEQGREIYRDMHTKTEQVLQKEIPRFD